MNVASWNPDRPHNDLPPIPLAEDLETKPVLRACVESRAALAGLKQAAGLIPNQAMLINTLPVLEARASSAVENIVTTTDKLFESLHCGPVGYRGEPDAVRQGDERQRAGGRTAVRRMTVVR